VDAEPQLAQKYGIMSVPTMIIFKNGAIDNQFIGVQPKQALANALA